ncbi:MAG TPA: Kdo hydroxylase family protein [Verrucomicrobiae bacterium]|nr:Kdo hydroxylase family protein [Verrucomicrobiae bacterium]
MTTSSNLTTLEGAPARAALQVLAPVEDYRFPEGWMAPASAPFRARQCCARLEEGRVLFLDRIPFDFPREDREFLLAQRQSGSKLHKNVSYRPRADIIRGAAGPRADVDRLHQIMRRYSAETVRFLGELLAPYAAHWSLDYASYRPEEEKGRDLPVHKRNDLLHVDAFPTRPMHGRRILRCFTNINPRAARVWHTTDGFETLAHKYADEAGLRDFAARSHTRAHPLLSGVKRMLGFKAPDHSAYDKFMLRFHDFLKERADFQQSCPKTRIEFPPCSTWICFTDSVPHAVLSGQFALEQTFIIPVQALVTPERAPIRILEKIAGARLAPHHEQI